MYIKRNEKQLIEALESFSTCDISDGLLNVYKIRNGGYIPNVEPRSLPKDNKGKSIVGRAYTVKYVSKFDSKYIETASTNYADKISEGSILVSRFSEDLQLEVAPYVRPIMAIFGGLNATRAQYLKCRGAVILGRVRDVRELQEMSFPVYSYGVSSCSSNSNLKPISTEKTLHILTSDRNRISVNSGDLIIMDENGVVCVPCTSGVDFDNLIEYIEKSIKVDKLILKDIKEGKCIKSSKSERRNVLKEMFK